MTFLVQEMERVGQVVIGPFQLMYCILLLYNTVNYGIGLESLHTTIFNNYTNFRSSPAVADRDMVLVVQSTTLFFQKIVK